MDDPASAWERRYAAGRALNVYPFDAVVTLTSRYFGSHDRTGLRVLDLGSGAGNHALFFARLGFQVTCVDVSATAHDVARRRFHDEGLSAEFHVMGFDEIGALGTFDLVLDRGSLCYESFERLQGIIVPCIRDVLRDGGLLFSCFLSKQHPAGQKLMGSSVPRHVESSDTDGGLPLTLLAREDVARLFESLSVVQLYHLSCAELFVAEGEPALKSGAEFVIVCRREA